MCEKIDFSQLDNVAHSIFVLEVDGDDRPVYAAMNAFARDLSGMDQSDFLGKTACEIYDGAPGQVAYERHCAVARKGTPMAYELELPFKSGTRLVHTTLNPVKDTDGRVTMIFGSSVDRSSDRDVQEAQVQIKTLTNEMEQFVAMAAHDLRAPMRNVGMLADMLRDGFVDHGDGKTELIDMLEDIATRSLALITDVLSHARATSSEDKATVFAFDQLCRDIFAVLDPQGHHELQATDATLLADRAALQIVVRNLIENAMKHGGRARLTIRADVKPKDANQMEFSISDDGVGFENPGIQFLEDGDFRINSGYGLLGIRRLIKARGGDISASNQEGGGSLVTFILPGQLQDESEARRAMGA